MLESFAHFDGLFDTFHDGGTVVASSETEVCSKVPPVRDDLDVVIELFPDVLSESVACVFVGGEVVGLVGSNAGSDVTKVVVRGVKSVGEGLQVPFSSGDDEEVVGKDAWYSIIGLDYEKPRSEKKGGEHHG